MIHNLPTCRLLTVEVPEGATGVSVWEATMNLMGYKKGDLFLGYVHDREAHNNAIPPGNWELLGRFEDVTEDVWKEIMPYDVDVDIESGHYYDLLYRDFNDVQQIIPSSYTLDTATESARSLIAGNPVVLIERKKE